MSNVTTTAQHTIRYLVESVGSGQILLPEIQRGYVWKAGQVAHLIDSLYRGYPTGAMLLWRPSQEVAERSLAISALAGGGAFEPLYLLDGQQRLTSLHRAFTDHPDAQIVFFVEEDRFQVQSAATKQDPRWVKVADILGTDKLLPLATTAAAEGKIDAEAAFEALQRIKRIADRLVHVEVVERLPYDEVAQIFVRVNSGGRRLQTVDLTLALLSTAWPGVVRQIDSLVAHWKGQSWPGIDATFLIRALAATGTESGLLAQLPRAARDDLAAMQEAWKDVEFGIEFVVALLRENVGISSSELLTSMNALVPLVALLGRYRTRGKEALTEADALIYWLFAVLIRGRFSQSADSRIAQDALAVRKADPIRALYENAGLIGAPLRVTSDELAGKGASSTYFMLSYLAARRRGAKDWWHDVVVGPHGAGGFSLEYHHVHPRATLKGTYTKAEINDLANLAFISATANKKILDRSPAEYFRELHDPDAQRDELSPHLVPTELELRTADRYRQFLARRRELLATAITELLDERRPSWITGTAPTDRSGPARSLSLTLYAEPWSAMVFDARCNGDRYTTSVPIVDLERFIGDARDGLASSLALDGAIVEYTPELEELSIPIGPFLVTGDITSWELVLDRERQDIAEPPGDGPPAGQPWDGEREQFDVLDSD